MIELSVETLKNTKPNKKLLFICTGNTCRSPFAEAFLKHRISGSDLEAVLEVSSAGLLAGSGLPASGMSLEVARARGIDLEAHRSRPLTPELLASADFLIVMQLSHKLLLQDNQASKGKEIRLLGEFNPGGDPIPEIPDPYGGSRQTYEECFEKISLAVDGLFKHLIVRIQDRETDLES